jgi:hypothetical protein
LLFAVTDFKRIRFWASGSRPARIQLIGKFIIGYAFPAPGAATRALTAALAAAP